MPLDPNEFFDHVQSATGTDGRLPLSRMTGWEVFPFEPDRLRVVTLQEPALPEPPRNGEDGTGCHSCAHDEDGTWMHERWRLTVFEESGAPLVLMLHSREHVDFTTISDELASELGVLTVHIARAIEALPHIARAHVSRWGDGGAHLHVFFFARPAGFPQLRGTCLAVWDDLLPAQPVEVVRADAAQVAAALADSFGGSAS